MPAPGSQGPHRILTPELTPAGMTRKDRGTQLPHRSYEPAPGSKGPHRIPAPEDGGKDRAHFLHMFLIHVWALDSDFFCFVGPRNCRCILQVWECPNMGRGAVAREFLSKFIQSWTFVEMQTHFVNVLFNRANSTILFYKICLANVLPIVKNKYLKRHRIFQKRPPI